MAKGVINLQKESGGIIKISPADGIGVTEVTVPESGELVTKEYVDNGAGAVFVANDTRVKTALNATGNAPIYACRAWVNFNGTGTVAIRSSGNVSSITDNGIGLYSINFTTAIGNSNYSIVGNCSMDTNFESGERIQVLSAYKYNSSNVSIQTNIANSTSPVNGFYDMANVSIAIFK